MASERGVSKPAVTRRRLLQVSVVGGAGAALAAALAACGETQIITKEVPVEKTVIKEVPVEKVVTVTEIKEVPVEKVVTKEVVVEKVVTKVVPVEKVVTKVVTKEVVVEKVVTVEVPTTVEAGQPVKGGVLQRSGLMSGGKPVYHPYRQGIKGQSYINEVVWLNLWYGNTWGDGPIPALGGGWSPGAADRWDEIEPSRVYNFHINPDLKWHDGKPVTADDVLFSFQMGIDPAYGVKLAASDYAPVKGAEAWAENPTDDVADAGGVTKIDEMTVQVELEKPDPSWWGLAGATSNTLRLLPPMPKHVYEGIEPSAAIEESEYSLYPVGNGPMKLKRVVQDQYTELESNPDFAYGAPWVDGCLYRIGDWDALDVAAEAGELDFHRVRTGVTSFVRLSQLAHLRPVPLRAPHGGLIFLNFAKEIFEGVNVSLLIEAMVMAIDRETINEQLEEGTLYVSDWAFAHVPLLQDPPEDAYRTIPYDPEGAKDLIAESGFDTSNTIKWLMWSSPTPTFLAMQEYFTAVGLDVEFFVIDVAAVVDELYLKTSQDMVIANIGGMPLLRDSWRRLKCGWTYEEGGYNHSNVCDPELDALYEKALAATTVEELRESWLDVSRRFHARGTMPAGMLWRGSVLETYHRRVQGVFWGTTYALPVRSPIEQVWIDPRWNKNQFVG